MLVNLKKTRLISLLFFFLIVGLLTGQIASAEGDGTGGGKSEPLSLVSSSIQNGATGVPLKPEIKLTFSKNIVNMTVSDNNRKCFSLLSETGAATPIKVIFVDDQINPEGRDDAVIVPNDNLSPGTTYTLVISSALKSKSGATTGKETKITFTTEGSKPAAANTTPASPAQTPATPAPDSSKATPGTTSTTGSVPANNTAKTASPDGQQQQEQQQSTETQAATDTAAVETQPVSADMEEKEPANEEKAEKHEPYTAAKSSASTAEKQQSDGTNSLWLMTGIVLLIVISAGTIYFYRKKKLAK
ncbi:Ig-like domain-containing protein [Neobacillus niacini]|uniref:Ig-like domain-containing protein n=1 Tax=Neobacillus niacini TaxID=86668 RepID=UPI0021CB59F6|nr:Ig-like domain-containing protein [Neobacillus niacini]MCM3763671.1 Ig-like domain-containing protein [Neobacillus niacini]